MPVTEQLMTSPLAASLIVRRRVPGVPSSLRLLTVKVAAQSKAGMLRNAPMRVEGLFIDRRRRNFADQCDLPGRFGPRLSGELGALHRRQIKNRLLAHGDFTFGDAILID